MNDRLICQESLRFSRSGQPQDTVPLPTSKSSADKLHLFDPVVAASHGLVAAVLYQYLSWSCRKFGQWTGTRQGLLETFPYLTAEEIRLALSKLQGVPSRFAAGESACQRLIEQTRKGTAYGFVRVARVKSRSLHAFDPRVAMEHGILAAVVYDNMIYWIAEAGDDGEDEPSCYTSPTQWQQAHTYAPLRTVKRAFQTLRLAGRLVIAGRNGRLTVWTLPEIQGREIVNRWRRLHGQIKTASTVEPGKTRNIHMPALYDEDLE